MVEKLDMFMKTPEIIEIFVTVKFAENKYNIVTKQKKFFFFFFFLITLWESKIPKGKFPKLLHTFF